MLAKVDGWMDNHPFYAETLFRASESRLSRWFRMPFELL